MEAIEERFVEKIRLVGDCWIWTGARVGSGLKRNYAWFNRQRAHRWAYKYMIGEIPTGLTLDHLCRNTLCVNPFHCEPVPNRVNVLRGTGPTAVNAVKTHCVHGHRLAGENLRTRPDGRRQCRACWG